MKTISFLALSFLITVLVIGQDKVNVEVLFTSEEIVIDGSEDDAWGNVDANSVDKNFQSETPTVTAYWKALWDNNFFYVLINVEDDDHWPAWKSGGNWYEYDQTEVYFDVNAELNDGLGVNDRQGHYQAVGKFAEGISGVIQDIEIDDRRPVGTFCYEVTGENYIIEYALDFTSFVNSDGITLSVEDFKSMEEIGFDVTVIDQDEGVTTSRQRAVWHNIGETNENYVFMDDAGTITLIEEAEPESISSHTIKNLRLYPNPAKDYISCNVDFDKLFINNILGKELLMVNESSNTIDISSLPEGVYFARVYKSGVLIGMEIFVKK